MTDRCRELIDLELELYDRDYAAACGAGKKAKESGRPVFLESEGSDCAVLLMHGYLSGPAEVRPLAEFLHSKGYTVYVPRLPGHGTVPEDLLTRSWKEWYDAARRGYGIVKECSPTVIAAGFSMGAALALLNASRHPDDFRAVISVSAPLRMKGLGLRLSPVLYLVQRMSSALGMNIVPPLLDHRPENPDINYTRNPLKGLFELHAAVRAAKRKLKGIKAPLCALQADNDPVIRRSSLDLLCRKAGSKMKERHCVHCGRHVIIRGETSRDVFEAIGNFLDKVTSAR